MGNGLPTTGSFHSRARDITAASVSAVSSTMGITGDRCRMACTKCSLRVIPQVRHDGTQDLTHARVIVDHQYPRMTCISHSDGALCSHHANHPGIG
jgi:hypothetical protein